MTGSIACRKSADIEASPVVSGKVAPCSITHDQPSAMVRSKVTRSSVVAGSTSFAPSAGSSRTTRGGAAGAGALAACAGSDAIGAAPTAAPRVEKVQRTGVARCPCWSLK